MEFPTGQLIGYLLDETTMNNTRFSMINNISKKPVAEVDRYSLETPGLRS